MTLHVFDTRRPTWPRSPARVRPALADSSFPGLGVAIGFAFGAIAWAAIAYVGHLLGGPLGGFLLSAVAACALVVVVALALSSGDEAADR